MRIPLLLLASTAFPLLIVGTPASAAEETIGSQKAGSPAIVLAQAEPEQDPNAPRRRRPDAPGAERGPTEGAGPREGRPRAPGAGPGPAGEAPGQIERGPRPQQAPGAPGAQRPARSETPAQAAPEAPRPT